MIARFGPYGLVYPNGEPAGNSEVAVVINDSDELADIYIDGGVTPGDNPFQTDALGNISFFAEEGQYDLLINEARISITVEHEDSGGATERIVHRQASPAANWEIIHNRDSKPPIVLVLDSAPEEPVYTDITYPDLNRALVEFPVPETGYAYIP